MPRYNEPNIVFSKKDTRGIRQPHDDPLVIMLKMEEFNMHQVLIDNGSSAGIIHPINEVEQGKVTTIHFPIGKFHWG